MITTRFVTNPSWPTPTMPTEEELLILEDQYVAAKAGNTEAFSALVTNLQQFLNVTGAENAVLRWYEEFQLKEAGPRTRGYIRGAIEWGIRQKYSKYAPYAKSASAIETKSEHDIEIKSESAVIATTKRRKAAVSGEKADLLRAMMIK